MDKATINELLLSVPAAVYLQGDAALHFVEDRPDCAVFTLIGFTDLAVAIQDRRQKSREALAYIFASGDVSQFAEQFQRPALVDLFKEPDGGLVVRLPETADPGKKYGLWMPVGIENRIPNYNYLFLEANYIDDEHLAVLSIYRRPYKRSSKMIRTAKAGRGVMLSRSVN